MQNKNVVAAARSIIRLYRQINPELLPRKECGRLTESQVDILTHDIPHDVAINYGQCITSSVVPGAEVLVLASEQSGAKKNQLSKETDYNQKECGNEDDNSWESYSNDEESEDDDSDGEWVNLSNSSDDEEEEVEKNNDIMDADNSGENASTKKPNIDPMF
ncbi:unnamed protein product [Heterobilharzia americana]|nr:unnamed protein product [Heterobilharzia americana]